MLTKKKQNYILLTIINLTILECKLLEQFNPHFVNLNNKSNHIGM